MLFFGKKRAARLARRTSWDLVGELVALILIGLILSGLYSLVPM
jgi:hypothetical protein